jgi:chitinase
MEKSQQYGVRLIVGIGGANGTQYFSSIALSGVKSDVFIARCIDLVIKHQFDGVLIDWEFPGWNKGCAEVSTIEARAHAGLLKKLKLAMNDLNRELTLTTVVQSLPSNGTEYCYETLNNCCDFIQVMAYEYFSAYPSYWGTAAWHHSPLFDRSESFIQAASGLEKKKASMSTSVGFYLERGISAEKLVVGMPLYGRLLPDCTGIGQPYRQPRDEDVLEDWVYTYRQLAQLKRDSAVRWYWDASAMAPYAKISNDLLIFSDERSFSYKAEYVKKAGLAGVSMWELTFDVDEFSVVRGFNINLNGD